MTETQTKQEAPKGAEAQAPAEQNKSGAINKNASQSPVPLLVGGGILLILVAGGLAFAAWSFFDTATPNNSQYSNVANAFEETDALVESGVENVLQSINYDEFGGEDVKNVFDIDAFISRAEDNLDKLGFLVPQETTELEGKTTHTATDVYVDIDMKDDDNDVVADLKVDMYTTYPDEIDEELTELVNDGDVEKLVEYLEDIDSEDLAEQIGKLQLDIVAEVEQGDSELSFDASLFMDNADFYAVLNEFTATGELEDTAQPIALLEGDVATVDLMEGLELLVDSIDAEALEEFTVEEDPAETLEEQLQTTYEELLADLDEDQVELVQQSGQEINDVIVKEIDNLTLFSDVEAFDAIREDATSKCREARLDLEALLIAVEGSVLDSLDVLEENGAEDVEEARDEFIDGLEEARDMLEDSEVMTHVIVCNDRKEGYLSGFGFDVEFVNPEDSDEKFDIRVVSMIVSNDSDYEIEFPEADIDFTEQFNQMVEDYQDTLESMLMNGGLMAPGLLDTPTVPGLGSDVIDDSNSSFGDIDYEGYYDEYEALTDQYLNGELTDQEYFDALDALDEEYYGDL